MTPSFKLFAFLRPAALLLLAATVAACGQTGSLHLPEDAPSKENYLLKKRPAKPSTTTVAAPAEPAADPVPPEAPSPDSPKP